MIESDYKAQLSKIQNEQDSVKQELKSVRSKEKIFSI
ncbi:hypothetical protein IGJ34_000051 [Enterococcus sp. AZ177]